MEMPDGILLKNINLRNAFLDRKSIEANTGKIKAKYKLLTFKDLILRDLGVFVFHILTTGKDSYIKEKTMDIFLADWEYRDGTHLNSECSKLCSQKVDIINKEVLLEKIRDTNNRFPHTGTLSQIKFNEILKFIREDFEKTDLKTDFDVKEIINSMFDKKQVAKNILDKFGL
ncbi:MAG: hypothetical protein AAB500_00710 [Patescibacteria group bacterium]